MSNDFIECHDFKVARTFHSFKSLIKLTEYEIITRKEINNNCYNLCFGQAQSERSYFDLDSHLKESGR